MSRPDTQLHPAHIARMRRSRDVAYACFGYFGVMLATAFVLNHIPTSWLVQHWLGALLSLPIVMAGFVVAGLLGIAYSARARSEVPLLALAAMTAMMPVLLLVVATTSMVPTWLGTGFFTAYTLAALVLPLQWFTRTRRAWISPGSDRRAPSEQTGPGGIQSERIRSDQAQQPSRSSSTSTRTW